jgi:hypothetical protein
MTIIGLGATLAGFLMPELSLWPDVIVRSLLVAILFTAGVYLWKLSDDMNMLIDPFIDRLKKRL